MWLPATMGMYAIVAGAFALVGWIANVPRLCDWDLNGLSILPNTALCAVFAGLAVVLLAAGQRRAPAVIGVLLAAIGALTLFEHATGIDVGLDRLLWPRAWGQALTTSPGRMGVPSSFAWTVLGVTAVVSRLSPRYRVLAATSGIVLASMSLFILVGAIYGARPLYAIPRITAMAPETATCVFALGIALIALVPERGLAAQLGRADAGGMLARRLLLPVLVLPVLLGWLRVQGQRLGAFDALAGTALRTVTEMALLVALGWWIARSLSRADQARQRDQAALRDQFDAAQTLQRLSTQLVRADDPGALFEQVLDAAVSIAHSDCGSLQMLDAERGQLRLLCARGFDAEARRACEWVSAGETTSCARAFRDERRWIVRDVAQSDFPADGFARRQWARLGVRAVQSTPLVSRDGRVLGMITTHWRTPHEPGESELRLLDILARQAADVVERAQAVASLRDRERTQRLLAEIGVLAARSGIAGGEPDAMLAQTIFDSVARDLGVPRCGLTRADLAAGSVTVEHDAHFGLPSMRGSFAIADYAEHLAQDATAGRTTVVTDLATDPRTAALYESRYAPLKVRSYVSAPVHRDGRWVGGFWAASDAPRAWSKGEIELVQTIAQGVWLILEQARIGAALRESESRLAVEADALAQLNELSARLWQAQTLPEGLQQMLGAALLLLGADRGNVQLLAEDRPVLRVATQLGFERAFLDHFAEVDVDDGSACARAFHACERIVVADVEKDAAYAPHRAIARAAGYRAVQSTPLVGRDGRPMGVISTHFRTPHTPSEQELRSFDLYVRHAVAFLERMRAEEALREAERRKDEFLAILAHELRNPLAPVRNAAHYLRLRELPEADLRRPVEMIERQVTHMARLIEDLLDASRISRGMLELRLEPVPVSELLDAAVDACADDVRARGHALALSPPDRPIELLADRARLIQALSNLVSNAAKYTPNGGRIEIAARATGDTLEVRVKDNGIGIPREKLREIFELFAQVDRSLERHGGLGIGLTLARQLIELHGGSIEARSAGPGQGSEFVVALPIALQARSADGPAPAGGQTRGERRRILVADDNPDAVESLALLLRLHGHEVHTAYDGEEAARTAHAVRPEVALLDIGMPGLNGYEAARHIRAQSWGREMFLVALTGWGQAEDRRRAAGSGFDAHLVKPVAPEALDALLARPAAGEGATVSPASATRPA